MISFFFSLSLSLPLFPRVARDIASPGSRGREILAKTRVLYRNYSLSVHSAVQQQELGVSCGTTEHLFSRNFAKEFAFSFPSLHPFRVRVTSSQFSFFTSLTPPSTRAFFCHAFSLFLHFETQVETKEGKEEVCRANLYDACLTRTRLTTRGEWKSARYEWSKFEEFMIPSFFPSNFRGHEWWHYV